MKSSTGTYLGLALAASLGASAALAQKPSGLPGNYPSKPIRFIISSSPGGAVDTCGRTVQLKLNERWGSVIAENRPGQGVAYAAAAQAAPDGYTLLATSISTYNGAELVLKLPYNMATKFPAIAQCISTPYIVSVNNGLPVKNIKELIAYAKANPNKLNYAYSALGGAPHLFGALLKHTAKIDMEGIPYKGVGPSYVDQMAGRINLTVGTAASAGPHVKAGKIRGIAVTSAKRIKALPELPTVRETLPDFDIFEGWVGILGLEGMPAPIINALNKEINSILDLPDVEKILTGDGSEITQPSPAEFQKVIRESVESTARIVREANIPLTKKK